MLLKTTFGAITAIASYTLLEAVRNRLVYLAVGLVLLGFVLVEFVSEVAITESVEFQSAFLGGFLRACSVLVVSLFVVTSIVREFNDKVLELVLSLPIPRSSYFLGKLLGFCAFSLLIAALFSAALLLYAPASAAIFWGLSLWCELALVVALSLLCLFTFSQVTLALSAVFAFYILARSMTAFQLMADSPLLHSRSAAQQLMNGLMDGIAFLLPDLDRFTPF